MTERSANEGRARPSISTTRLEAFSDGVIAIAITLLVLELVPPALSEGDVAQALLDQWPAYLAYVVSFASIGAAWASHSRITDHLERADGALIRMNLLFLFFVSVVPFSTAMLGEYLRESDAERIAATVYGVNLLAIDGVRSVMWRHAVSERLIEPDLPAEEVHRIAATSAPSLGAYAVAIVVGLLAPTVAVVLYLVIALYLLLPLGALFRRRR